VDTRNEESIGLVKLLYSMIPAVTSVTFLYEIETGKFRSRSGQRREKERAREMD